MKKRGAKFKRGVSIDGVARLIRQNGLEKEKKVDLLLNPLVALNELLNGEKPAKYHWDIVASAVNLAHLGEKIASSGEGAAIERAMKNLAACWDRGVETGKWRLNGDWLGDIKTALQVYEAQLDLMTRNELQAALNFLVGQLDLHSAWKNKGEQCALIYHNAYKNASIRYFDDFESMLSAFGICDFAGFGNDETDDDIAAKLVKQLIDKSGCKISPEIYVLSRSRFSVSQWYAHDNSLITSFVSRGWG